jgi:Putative zinc-finger
MTDERQSCPSFGELADYWTSDIAPADAERIEAHVFECASCARLLAESERLRNSISALARGGEFQAFVTDGLLNQLARDGVRVRSYALEPGETITCSAWDDDEVVVARLRADFAGVTAVDAEMRLESGERWGRSSDVPVREGATELVLALPATMVRSAPHGPMRLTLRASSGSQSADVIAEYVFDHEGAHQRGSR